MNGCLCPCPDYIKIPLPHGQHKTIYLHWNNDVVLYGKKSTTNCERCGVGLCEKCAVAGGYGFENGVVFFWDRCPTCEEMDK